MNIAMPSGNICNKGAPATASKERIENRYVNPERMLSIQNTEGCREEIEVSQQALKFAKFKKLENNK